MPKKIISFSLWGSDPKYLIGAEKNIQLQQQYYPGWICRYYLDESVPFNTVHFLGEQGAEIIVKDKSNGYEGLFWRFEPAFDETVERFIVRDCDSRLNAREADAVSQWIESNLPFHSMRDHRGHDVPILGAMWGAKSFFIHDFKNIYYWFIEQVEKAPIIKRERFFYTDQIFLNQIIWPKISGNCLIHDDLKRFTGTEEMFHVKLPDGQFVGQQWGADNKPLIVPI
jgi:hypothetical protein